MTEHENSSTKDVFKTKHQRTLHTDFSSMTTANQTQNTHSHQSHYLTVNMISM